MITLLVVAPPEDAEELDSVAARKPSLELLHARDVEEALERLSRNRRIDAVLLLMPPDSVREIAAVIREEDPSAPPLFAPAAIGTVPDVGPLPATTPEELLAAVTKRLSAG
ncbi:MAG: hypothetical protein M3547_02160 [Acidobacteriota bacterium]|nr:hypothetical protein [Acidobacteriota bacterium]